jgi:hypothetical protein
LGSGGKGSKRDNPEVPVHAEPRPKRPIAGALRQLLNDEPSPWAVTLFLWSLGLFLAATGAAGVTLLLETLAS